MRAARLGPDRGSDSTSVKQPSLAHVLNTFRRRLSRRSDWQLRLPREVTVIDRHQPSRHAPLRRQRREGRKCGPQRPVPTAESASPRVAPMAKLFLAGAHRPSRGKPSQSTGPDAASSARGSTTAARIYGADMQEWKEARPNWRRVRRKSADRTAPGPQEAGAIVTSSALTSGRAASAGSAAWRFSATFIAEELVADCTAEDFDAVLIPGGNSTASAPTTRCIASCVSSIRSRSRCSRSVTGQVLSPRSWCADGR